MKDQEIGVGWRDVTEPGTIPWVYFAGVWVDTILPTTIVHVELVAELWSTKTDLQRPRLIIWFYRLPSVSVVQDRKKTGAIDLQSTLVQSQRQFR